MVRIHQMISAALVSLLALALGVASPVAALTISGVIESQVRWAAVASGSNEPARDVRGTTRLTLQGLETLRGPLPGAVTITAETAPEAPVYSDIYGDRLRRADLRTLAVATNVTVLPGLSIGGDYALKQLDEASGSGGLPSTQRAYGAGFKYSQPNRPALFGEIRSTTVRDNLDGRLNNSENLIRKLGVKYDSTSLSYAADGFENSTIDHTGLYPDQTTRALSGAWRWNPASNATFAASYQQSRLVDGAYQEDGEAFSLNGALVVAPRLQLRSGYQTAAATYPVDEAVLYRAGVGVDLETLGRIRLSGDRRREVRWDDWTGTSAAYAVWEARAETELGRNLLTLRYQWDDEETAQADQHKRRTGGVELAWPMGRFAKGSLGLYRVQDYAGAVPQGSELYVYPEVSYQREVARGLSTGVSARATLALGGENQLSRDTSGTLFVRGQLGGGFQADMSFSGQGTRTRTGTWSYSESLAAAISRPSAASLAPSLSYRLTSTSSDWDPHPLDDERATRAEELQLGLVAPFGRTTWFADLSWNMMENYSDPEARRHWWTAGTGLRWLF